MATTLRDFLEIPYDKLEEMNLATKEARLNRTPAHKLREKHMKYLADEKRIKAVTVCFSDLEGRLHMLDYDKKFLLKSADNLTFDGSSIRGFSQQAESDLRLGIDWPALYWLPSDIFGPGKVLVFADVLEKDGSPYLADMRLKLKAYTEKKFAKDGTVFNAANEIEGFLFKGRDAERHYHETAAFEFISTGGYYHSLPGDPLRTFIDTAAEVQRALGFANEKDHPEVAPSQFEMNYALQRSQHRRRSGPALQARLPSGRRAARHDRQLPAEAGHRRQRQRHAHELVHRQGRQEPVLRREGPGPARRRSGWQFIDRVLASGQEICLLFNPSVNAYRRLDPHYEAPNQIKASAVNRGAMVRIPIGNEKSARIEIRSIAPDANPYLALYAALRTGSKGPLGDEDAEARRARTKFLPDNIYDAIRLFKGSKFMADLLGAEVHDRYIGVKTAQADRCPRALGSRIKTSEVQFHHEVTNQYLWNQF